MPVPERESTRELIAERIAELHGRYYGRQPEAAEVYIEEGKIVVVVLRETFSQAERTIIQHGAPEVESVQAIRRRFQGIMRDDFIAVIEQATGSRVETFTSDTDLESAVAVEVFLLAGRRGDMSSFEYEDDDDDDQETDVRDG